MKTIKIATGLLVTSFMFQSCVKREFWPLRGKGDIISEQRETGQFTSILLCNDATVEYVQDSVYSVTASGQSNILDVLKTTVDGQALKISYDKDVWDHKEVKITVRGPRVHALSVSGSGNIRTEGTLQGEKIELNVTGSGEILVKDLTAPVVTACVSGSGNVELLGGHSDSSHYIVSGSGNISAEHLVSRANTSHISGSGNITVNVTEQINVTVSGSGNFYYKGSAGITSETTGSGKVRRI